MNTSSLQFVLFALLAACVYNLFRSVLWRQWTLLVANVCFLLTFASSFRAFLPFAVFLLLGFLGIRSVQSPSARKAYVPLVVAVVLIFIWLKKYTFLPSGALLSFSYFTVGLSYILFRVLHVMIDAHSSRVRGMGPVAYLNYTLNFLTLVSGPIQRYEDFAASQLTPVRPSLTIIDMGEGLHRVVVGFFKVTVLCWLLSPLQKQALAALSGNPFWGSKLLTGAIAVVAFPLYLYFNFSGYTDMVIGLGRFFRFELPENFDRPLFACSAIEFWNRWHITLSNWLKTYVFNPLLLAEMRRFPSESAEPFLAVPAFFITFSLVGIWHGQTSEFLFFGLLTGLGVAVNQLYRVLQNRFNRMGYRTLIANPLYTAFGRGLNFTWFVFTLLWFWSSWSQIRGITAGLGVAGTALVFLVIFVCATIVLSLLERIRNHALAVCWNGSPVVLSRYVLTVCDSGLMVISLVVVVLLNAPAPDIVYKAF